MNILITIGSFYDGGAELFAIRLANALSEKNKVIFLELQPYETKIKKQRVLLKPAVKVIHAGKNITGTLFNKKIFKGRLRQRVKNYYTSSSEKSIISILKTNNIEIVHSHCLVTDVYFAKLKTKYSFRLVSTLHGHYELEPKEKLFKCNNVFENIDKYIWNTNKQNDTLNALNVPEEKRRKIFYGIAENIAITPTIYKSGDTLKIVMAARGIAEKGWREAINAFLLLTESFNAKLRLELIGEGDFLKELKQQYSHPYIHFAGYVNNVITYIKDAHIALLPSYYKAESLPNAVIEYLICGKPVIATKTGSIEEMISYRKEKAGILIDLADEKVDTNELSNAIRMYIENPGLVEQHSKTAIKAATKFEMKNCTESYNTLYNQLLYAQYSKPL